MGNDLTIWLADRLGVQLHVGRRPQRDVFAPPRHAPESSDYLTLYKPSGGLWTSSQTPDGSSAALDTIAGFPLEGWYPDRKVWRCKPQAGARVLAIDGPDSLRAITDRYPYRRDRPYPSATEIDYPRILADGFAAVHLTAAGAAALECDGDAPHMQSWHHESTIWLDCSAIGRVSKVRAGRIQRDTTMTFGGATYDITYTPAYPLRLDPDAFQRVLPTRSGALTRQQLAEWVSVQVIAWNAAIAGEAVPIDVEALTRLPGRFLNCVAQTVLADCRRIIAPRRAAIERYDAWIKAQQRTLPPLRPTKRRGHDKEREQAV